MPSWRLQQVPLVLLGLEPDDISFATHRRLADHRYFRSVVWQPPHAMTPLLAFAGISLAVVITSFISGILGMAGGMILMGLLLLMMPVPAAMMLHGITQMASNGWRAVLWREKIDWRIFRGTAYGALVV